VTYALPGVTDGVDSSPDVSCSPESGATFPIGPTTVTCEATDDAGNESGVQFSVVVQEGPSPESPKLTADVPALTNKTSAEFQFSAENGVSLECRLRGPGASDTFAPCDSSQSYSGLDEGAYLFTVQATNQIGNVSQKSFSWTIDRTKPAAVANFRAKARDASVLLEWKKPVDADYDHVVVRRKRAGTTAWKTLAKRVNATSFKDTAVRNDVRYRYRIRSVDGARNPSAAVEIGGRPSKIFSPVFGAVLRSPPLIDWTYVKDASYFNVQVWRNGRKVLSRWPVRTSLQMRSSWTYGGKQFTFSSGHYVIYAWPGFGSKAAASYGPLLGWTSFDVR
jgi:HYR domain